MDTSGDERVKATIVAAEALLKELQDEYFCYARSFAVHAGGPFAETLPAS